MLDLRPLVQTTTELEGDRLEMLVVYDRIEKLRALGRGIKKGDDGVLNNLDALLRSLAHIGKETKVSKIWPGLGGSV